MLAQLCNSFMIVSSVVELQIEGDMTSKEAQPIPI